MSEPAPRALVMKNLNFPCSLVVVCDLLKNSVGVTVLRVLLSLQLSICFLV